MIAVLAGPARVPSFAPLDVGPGLMMSINLGQILSGIKDALPEEAASIGSAADALSGDAGRIPMALTFNSEGVSFEMAVSQKTIEAVTAIVEEEKAKAAAAEPQPVITEESGE